MKKIKNEPTLASLLIVQCSVLGIEWRVEELEALYVGTVPNTISSYEIFSNILEKKRSSSSIKLREDRPDQRCSCLTSLTATIMGLLPASDGCLGRIAHHVTVPLENHHVSEVSPSRSCKHSCSSSGEDPLWCFL